MQHFNVLFTVYHSKLNYLAQQPTYAFPSPFWGLKTNIYQLHKFCQFLSDLQTCHMSIYRDFVWQHLSWQGERLLGLHSSGQGGKVLSVHNKAHPCSHCFSGTDLSLGTALFNPAVEPVSQHQLAVDQRVWLGCFHLQHTQTPPGAREGSINIRSETRSWFLQLIWSDQLHHGPLRRTWIKNLILRDYREKISTQFQN